MCRLPDSVAITEELLRGWPLPRPGDGGKDERGRIFVVAGAPQMPGAAVLCGTAALRAGAGKLQIGTCASVAALVGCGVPEAFVVALDETRSGAISRGSAATIVEHANGGDALVIGPGLVDQYASAELISTVAWKLDVPVVVDAAALACFADRADTFAHLGGRAVLTPHAGEMATDAAVLARGRRACAGSIRAGCCARRSVPWSRSRARRRSSPSLTARSTATTTATQGSRRRARATCLAGIAGGLLARGVEPLHAAVWAVALHARAGDALAERIGLGFLARELAAEVPPLMRKLSECAS